MEQSPILRLTGVSKRFAGVGRRAQPVQALKDVSFDLPSGQFMGLIGPDAGGKTTLLRMLAGLLQSDEGEVEILGRPVAELDRSLIGYMPQGGALYAELTVRRNLELYARLRGIEPDNDPERMDRLYRLTGLLHFTERPAGQLSGGMRQKLAMACAVVASPPLMLLDEPSVGVDPVSRLEIWQLVRELAGPDAGIIWATSILDDAQRCDSVLLLHEGAVRYCGHPDGLADRARGRTYVRPLSGTARRYALQQLLEAPDVATASVRGDGLLAVTRTALAPAFGRGWTERPPRAEDGFAILLDDGEPLGPSALAAAFPKRVSSRETPAIAAIGLTRRFGDYIAAQDITFTVYPGEIFGLLGPNGAGKSTTFRMLSGLIAPTGGRGAVCGRDLTTARAEAREVMGYMPQKFSLYGDLTLGANLRFVAGAYGLTRGAASAAIERVVQALSLARYWSMQVGQLPLGIKQRLSLAAAVMHTPPVLFLDEPTSGVDPMVRREFWHHINAIAARGTAVLVTTHFMDEAENCDRLLLVNQSEAVAQGTPYDLRRNAVIVGRQAATLEDAFIALIEAQNSGDLAA